MRDRNAIILYFVSILLLASFVLPACGFSTEEIATQTASAWTTTPMPTYTPTSTITSSYTPTATSSQTPTSTPSPTATPVPVISGALTPWEGDTPINGRNLVLCQIVGETETLPTDCTLIEELTTKSNEQGTFQFTKVPPGEYFIFYDSGFSDFDTGLHLWGGETIMLGDRDWLLDEYFEKNDDGKISITIPAGAPLTLTKHPEWRITEYVIQTLLAGESPFILAHDINKAFREATIDFVVAEVSNNQPIYIEFQVLYFGKEQ